MRRFYFRALSIAAVVVGIVCALPCAVHAASSPPARYTLSPEDPHPSAGAQFQGLQVETPPAWATVSASDIPAFTPSLLNGHSQPIAAATLDQDSSKPPLAEKGPGAKVPEPGTLFLAAAALLGVARLSGRGRSVAK